MYGFVSFTGDTHVKIYLKGEKEKLIEECGGSGLNLYTYERKKWEKLYTNKVGK